MIVKRSSKLLILCSTWVLVGSCGLTRSKEKGEGWTVYPPLSALENNDKEEIMRCKERLKSTLTDFGGLTDSAERADAEMFLGLVEERYNSYKPADAAISKLVAVDKSQILVEVFGPSGSGKTVLLSSIAGCIQEKGGLVKFHDPESDRKPARKLPTFL